MTSLRTLPLLVLALLATACSKPAPPVMVTPAPLPVALPLPPQDAMAGALMMLADCDQDEDQDCSAKPLAVRIDGARCLPIPPEDGNPAVACRLDWTEEMPPPRRAALHRGECVRFILLDVDDTPGRKLWAVLYTPPEHRCEVAAQ